MSYPASISSSDLSLLPTSLPTGLFPRPEKNTSRAVNLFAVQELLESVARLRRSSPWRRVPLAPRRRECSRRIRSAKAKGKLDDKKTVFKRNNIQKNKHININDNIVVVVVVVVVFYSIG